MPDIDDPDAWAREYLAAALVTDMARDPDDYRVTRQSKVTIGGLLVPVSMEDGTMMSNLHRAYEQAFRYCRYGLWGSDQAWALPQLTGAMHKMIKQSATRTSEDVPDFSYISIDPQDYTVFTAPHVELPIISINTRPERCWFLGIIQFEGALGLSLGRMRVMRPNDKGMYPVTIRTKWRALTNKVKQEEVRDAYQRLIRPTC